MRTIHTVLERCTQFLPMHPQTQHTVSWPRPDSLTSVSPSESSPPVYRGLYTVSGAVQTRESHRRHSDRVTRASRSSEWLGGRQIDGWQGLKAFVPPNSCGGVVLLTTGASHAQEHTPALPALQLAAPVTTCTAAEERLPDPASPVHLGATAAQASTAVSNAAGSGQAVCKPSRLSLSGSMNFELVSF